MRYAKIVYNDVVNSDGMALTFYCQGCTHHCPGCFNKDTWNFNGGNQLTDKEINEMRYALSNYPYDNIVLLGGEPFDNIPTCMQIIELAREFNKKIWCYSGYTLDQLIDYAMAINIPYLAINFPIDTCNDCGYSSQINTDECPVCGSANIERLKRVTGY